MDERKNLFRLIKIINNQTKIELEPLNKSEDKVICLFHGMGK